MTAALMAAALTVVSGSFRRNCLCAEEKEESMSNKVINRIKNMNKMDRKGSVVLCPREGDHSGATDADGEEDVARLARVGRDGASGLNQGARGWWTCWREEFGIGGAGQTNLSSSSRRRLWRWAEEEDGGGASSA